MCRLQCAGPITKLAQIYKYTNSRIEDNYINKAVTKVSSDSAPAKIVSVSNTILIQNKYKNFSSVLVSYYKICFKTVIGFLNMSV